MKLGHSTLTVDVLAGRKFKEKETKFYFESHALFRLKVSFHLLHAFESKLVMLGFNACVQNSQKKVLENNKVKEKGMIVLSSAYKGGGRTDLSYNTEEQLITILRCNVRLQITLSYGSWI